ncbi:SigE family RNA polymerase sigma factor [Phytohabitans sp. ZYX-F-186]|uniref:SigE family RNA polymerase sigma factor n=1 Tax=Phytohabitans maris TaxID=3071409 RepID=A0ABU0ZDG0_9ACTN|nr:SigE family RNA polymerase sigma factor [Phytohabitans sp. ZYX-F-186]MDQ7905003.1 SigE family RNA polymerase sigma factor [Phytohabitans sp. ZYX-F-186]
MEDRDGFQEFVRARLMSLSRVAYLLAGDHNAAEDLVQSTLMKVALRWHQVREAADPDAYVRRILYNERISAWRRRGRGAEVLTDTPPERPSTVDEAEAVARRLMLRRALARLTARQRATIVLRFFEDLSPAEAAEVLGCSVNAVKSQTHHAVGRLRALAPELAELLERSTEVPR